MHPRLALARAQAIASAEAAWADLRTPAFGYSAGAHLLFAAALLLLPRAGLENDRPPPVVMVSIPPPPEEVVVPPPPPPKLRERAEPRVRQSAPIPPAEPQPAPEAQPRFSPSPRAVTGMTAPAAPQSQPRLETLQSETAEISAPALSASAARAAAMNAETLASDMRLNSPSLANAPEIAAPELNANDRPLAPGPLAPTPGQIAEPELASMRPGPTGLNRDQLAAQMAAENDEERRRREAEEATRRAALGTARPPAGANDGPVSTAPGGGQLAGGGNPGGGGRPGGGASGGVDAAIRGVSIGNWGEGEPGCTNPDDPRLSEYERDACKAKATALAVRTNREAAERAPLRPRGSEMFEAAAAAKAARPSQTKPVEACPAGEPGGNLGLGCINPR